MEFKNARIVKKANLYYEGKVSSRTIYTESGVRKSLGIILPGEYQFGTEAEEIMEVLAGEMEVMRADETTFSLYKEGMSFVVPANSSFKTIVKVFADYCCTYKD